MSAIITSDFRVLNAKNFKNNIISDSENVYLFIGKSDKWSSTLNGTSDVAPNGAVPLDTILTTRDADRNISALKSISGTDISNLILRYNWLSGTRYGAWDDNTQAIFDRGNDTPFYVITDSFAVYKCIYAPLNPAGNIVLSTSKPDHSPTISGSSLAGDVVTYPDGYIWKYMYKVTATEASRFLTNNYVPIKTVVGGSTVTLSTGAGTYPATGDTIIGAASGATAKVFSVTNTNTVTVYNIRGTFNTGEVVTGLGKTIVSIVLNNSTTVGEFGPLDADDLSRLAYQNAATASLTGKIYRIAIDADDPTATTLSYGGSGYGTTPTVTVFGDGSGATATAVVLNNKVISIQVASPGSNYNVAFVTITGGGGTGCVARAVLSPKNGHGSDPANELGGFYIGIAATLTGAEGAGDFGVNTQYRQVGLIRKPKELTSGGSIIPAISSTLSGLTTLTLNSITGTFIVGDSISNAGSAATAYIDTVTTGSTTTTLGIHQNDKTGYGTFAVGQPVSSSSGATGNIVTSGIAASEYVHFSGDIIFLENRSSAITRSASQIEDIRIITEF